MLSHQLAVTGYRHIGVDSLIGFLAGNGNSGDALWQSFQIEMPVG